ncbi:MAG: NADH-quinone oxidoreductase subunit J [Thaumarchaeota archaeon]|nr:NADH-quinone oxidoreductase subunit J [Nitrososphaerota archaeon]
MVDYFFLVLSVMTVGAAIIALESRELVYGAISLVVSLLGIAGLFILLDATFLAMLQILVFVGAVSVLIIFVVMLVRREKWVSVPSGYGRVAGLLVSILLIAGVGYLAMNSGIATMFPSSNSVPSYVDIGIKVLSDYWFPLQILGLVLASAVIGALTLAKFEGAEQ